MKSGIYTIIHLPTKKRYIGSTKNVPLRIYNHKWHLKRNTHCNKKLQNAWNKYSENQFAFLLLFKCDESVLLKLEQILIDYINPYYNLAHIAAGGFGRKHTSESIDKMKKSQLIASKKRVSWNKGKTGIYSQETIEKIREAARNQPRRYGYKFSEESKAKMSMAKIGKPPHNKGKKLSESHRKKLSESHMGKKRPPRSPDWSQKLSEAAKIRWAKQKNKQQNII